MSPKTPRKPPAATSHPPESVALPPRQLDGVSPALFPTPGLVDPTSPADAMGLQIVAPRLQPPAVEIFRMPTRGTQAPQANSPVHDYWLSDAFVHGMNPADADGFRWIVGRRFVDVEIDGAIKTTHVDLDESGVWRSKRLTERTASGPRLYKNADSPTWRLTEQPVPQRAAVTVSAQPDAAPVAKRPRLTSMKAVTALRSVRRMPRATTKCNRF
jgi:hypothetical protein